MAHRALFEIREAQVEVEFVYSRQIDDWIIGSWWTDEAGVTHRDVELATDGFLADNAPYWH